VVLPKILASRAGLLVFNRSWIAFPEIQADILRSAAHKHIILADDGKPDLRQLKLWVKSPIHLLTLSTARRSNHRIRVNCLRVNRSKTQ
jgi:hypothetical protein